MKKRNVYILWMLLILMMISAVAEKWTETARIHSPVIETLTLIFPALLISAHAIATLGKRWALLFLVISAGIGTAAELIGLKYGIFFGGIYTYKSQSLMLGNLPLVVSLFWAIFIYTGYSTTNALLVWLKQPKPRTLSKIVLLAIIDGLTITAIDVMLDPLAVQLGAWKWLNVGSHYGIPLGNFWGWFLVSSTASLVFRLAESHRKKIIEVDEQVTMMPVIGYVFLCSILLYSAITINMPELALIGFFSMMPIPIVNLVIWRINRTKTRAGV